MDPIKIFFANNMDYVYLFYGIGFFFLGTACLVLFSRRKTEPSISWLLLASFGFLHAINEWLDLLSFSFLDPGWFSWQRSMVLLLSFICLIEFSRRSIARLIKSRGCVFSIYAVLFGFMANLLSFSQSTSCLNTSIRYAFGFPGAIGAVIFFLLLPRHSKLFSDRWIYRTIGGVFLVYAFAAGLVVPESQFELSLYLNDANFFDTTGFPVYVLRGSCGTLIAFLLIFKATQSALSSWGSKRSIRVIWVMFLSFIAVYISVMISGFLIVKIGDSHEREHIKKIVLADAHVVSRALSAIDKDAFALTKEKASYPRYRQMHEYLSTLANTAHFIKNLYLISVENNIPVFVIGSEGQVFAHQMDPFFAKDIPKKSLLDAYYSKKPTLAGPYKDSRGEYVYSVFIPRDVSAPGSSQLLGVELDYKNVKKVISSVRLYLILVIMAFLILFVLGYAFLVVFVLKSVDLEVQKDNLKIALANLKVAEAELAKSEETFRGILNNSPNAIFGFDTDLRLIYWNHGAELLSGYEKDEVINEKDPLKNSKLTNLLRLEAHVGTLRSVFKDKTIQLEVRHFTRSGYADVIMTLFPVKDGQGHILFGMGIVQDVTDYKKVQSELLTAHGYLKSVLEGATQVAIIATDLNGLITVFNSGAEKLLGFSSLEMVGRQTPIVFHDPAQIQQHSEYLEKKFGYAVKGFDVFVEYARRGLFEEKEWTYIRKDNERILVDLTVTGLYDERRELKGFLGIALDLTKKKETEQALFDSQARYKELVENVNVGVYRSTVGPQGRFLEVNPALVAMFEAESKEALLSCFVCDLYVDPKKRESLSEKLLQQGFVKDEELELVTLKGKRIWCSVAAVLKHDSLGERYFYGIMQEVTQRREMEGFLNQERDRLKLIAASMGAGLILVNRMYEIEWVNDTLVRWFGEPGTESGDKAYALYKLRHEACPDCMTRLTFESGQMQTSEEKIVFPDGRAMDLLIISSPIKNKDGGVEKVLELVLDITEKNRILNLLDYERALSRNVIDSIAESLVVVDCQEKKIIDLNKAFLKMTGFQKREDLIGKKCTDIQVHFCPPCDSCKMDEVVREGRAVLSTHVHTDKSSGEKVFVDVTLSPLKDELGKVIGVINLAKDVSDRKRLEAELKNYSEKLEMLVEERTRALQNSEIMFRRLFESAQDGILIMEEQSGRILDANPYLLRILDCTREQVQGVLYAESSCFTDGWVFGRILTDLKKNTSVFYEEVSFKTCSGRDLILEVRSSLYFVEGKKVIQCSLRDITERKKIELIKSEFVSMVSHELRTPLSAIKEGVEIVADGTQGKLNRGQGECLGIALSNIKRLNRLIGDILDISKIQANLLNIKTSPCAINEVIDQVYSVTRIEIEKKGMVLITDIEKNLPAVKADKDRLIQILMNLLNNAVKFNTEKSRIVLSCRRSGIFAEFGVKDEGPGMKEEEVSRLFGKFVQLDSTLVRRVGGTGLGLFISKNLVQAMGGEIWAESKLGEGSIFKFMLPFVS